MKTAIWGTILLEQNVIFYLIFSPHIYLKKHVISYATRPYRPNNIRLGLSTTLTLSKNHVD